MGQCSVGVDKESVKHLTRVQLQGLGDGGELHHIQPALANLDFGDEAGRLAQALGELSLGKPRLLNSPFMQMQNRLNSPAFAAIYAARLWSDSLPGSHWAAQSSMQETLKLFQLAAEQAAALARVDVSELAAAVDASLGSLPEAAQASATPAATAAVSTGLEDFWKALPFEVRVFLELLWTLLFMPLYNRLWVEAPPEAQPQIMESIHEDLGEDFSRNLRCVRGAGIHIRESASKTAPIIGRLGRSQSVVVIKTEGSFSRIQYFDAATGEIREGWTASGYLIGAACWGAGTTYW